MMDNIVHSRPMDTNFNETTETDFNSTLLDDGTISSSHTAKTLIDHKDHDNNNTHKNINNIMISRPTLPITNINENHRYIQPVSSTELIRNAYPVKTTFSRLPKVNTSLPRLQCQNSVYFNTECVILNTST